jgi:hypothetical protein
MGRPDNPALSMAAGIGSNAVSVPVDSIVFTMLAFYGTMPFLVGDGDLLGKCNHQGYRDDCQYAVDLFRQRTA